jgi:hypothetical protein
LLHYHYAKTTGMQQPVGCNSWEHIQEITAVVAGKNEIYFKKNNTILKRRTYENY